MARSICAKSAFELWGHGKTHSELKASLLKNPPDVMSPYTQKDSTYRINVYTFNKTLEFKDRIERIDAMEYLAFDGRVNLTSPQHTFCLLEDYGTDPNNIPDEPLYIYFGRWIADGQRDLIRSYSVKNRHFIGNTSMDAGLSFIMANHARVKENDLVFDPFVGTGRCSRAKHKWRGPDENIRANLRQYGKEKAYVDVMVFGESHVPVSLAYHLSDIFADLLTFSARHLVMGGRLAYWLPVHSPEYCVEMVPGHPCLRVVSNSEQTLSSHTSRRLITMEKVKEPEESDLLVVMSESCLSPYQGHNAFREKYFSGVNKRGMKEEEEEEEEVVKMNINGE
ncbi:hypothetical protein CRUP_010574 [Coryphaenoides rupestris]|nr:hypothetical protein CRUP_010574 [Coryphaenoides rupestris]